MSIKSWRSKSATMLFTRPIYEREFPALARAMADDGLSIRLVNKGNGYELYVADYQVPAKSVREVWGLSPHQMRRFIDWALTNDTELL
jgi:hypothetical protein